MSDLYFQLRLFAGDGDFRDLGVEDLGAAFRAAASDAAAARAVTAVLRVALRPAPSDLDLAGLRRDVRAELAALRGVAHALAGLDAASDPKLARLVELLEGEARGEKVVVFTEFRDTARYLWRALVRRGGVALVDGGGAYLGTGACGRRQAVGRFAPRSNGVREPAARERVDLPIATDVLSEGLNLQDASRGVSYDLPWNPVRSIQRVGRVDRLAAGDPTVLEEAERRDAVVFEVEERLRAAYAACAAPDRPRRNPGAARLPLAARFVRDPGTDRTSRVLLGYESGGEAVWVVADPRRGTAAVDDGAAAGLLLEVLGQPGARAQPPWRRRPATRTPRRTRMRSPVR